MYVSIESSLIFVWAPVHKIDMALVTGYTMHQTQNIMWPIFWDGDSQAFDRVNFFNDMCTQTSEWEFLYSMKCTPGRIWPADLTSLYLINLREWQTKNWLRKIKLFLTSKTREVMIGEGNRVASVTLFTFTKRPGPHADTAWAVMG